MSALSVSDLFPITIFPTAETQHYILLLLTIMNVPYDSAKEAESSTIAFEETRYAAQLIALLFLLISVCNYFIYAQIAREYACVIHDYKLRRE